MGKGEGKNLYGVREIKQNTSRKGVTQHFLIDMN